MSDGLDGADSLIGDNGLTPFKRKAKAPAEPPAPPEPESAPRQQATIPTRFFIVLPDRNRLEMIEGETRYVGRDNGIPQFDEDLSVSYNHVRITVENGVFWITDIGTLGDGSTNGTIVPSMHPDTLKPGVPQRLIQGDVLIGDAKITLVREHG